MSLKNWLFTGAAALFALLTFTTSSLAANPRWLPSPNRPAAGPGKEVWIYQKRIQSVTVGTPRRYGGLTVFPLVGPSKNPNYFTMDEALAKGYLVVEKTDVSDRVKVKNQGTRPVMVVCGEFISGASGTWTFNSSFMVAARKTLIVSVNFTEGSKQVMKDLGDYLRQIPTKAGQVGALFAVNGEIAGFDLFDSDKTLQKLYPKLVYSYSEDAVAWKSKKPEDDVTRKQAQAFLNSAANADAGVYASQGLGSDLRTKAKGLEGMALISGGEAQHVAVFAE